jgi:integrase
MICSLLHTEPEHATQQGQCMGLANSKGQIPNGNQTGTGWVNFQVLRRTHCTLMRDLKMDPKLVADQLGHTLDVNLNV